MLNKCKETRKVRIPTLSGNNYYIFIIIAYNFSKLRTFPYISFIEHFHILSVMIFKDYIIFNCVYVCVPMFVP